MKDDDVKGIDVKTQKELQAEERAVCSLCGEPMPPGEEVFKFHGYSGPCPNPPLPVPVKPVVVCLCGSTRFGDAFRAANLAETLAGRIVLSIGCDFKSDQGLGLTEADKVRLDELHKRKIDLADEVLILNVGGYIGSSTQSEAQYAVAHGKRIRFLEEDATKGSWSEPFALEKATEEQP